MFRACFRASASLSLSGQRCATLGNSPALVSTGVREEMSATVKDDAKRSSGSSPRDEDEELDEQWRSLRQKFGEERWKLHACGLLEYTLGELIHLWPRELDRLGLTGGKDRSPSDVPQEPGMVLVEASDGRKVWIKPGAYRDEEGHLRMEVREHYARTDGAIWAMVAVLEGGEGITREGNLERTLQEDYKARRPLQAADEP
jgi:hypothetical protein